MCGPSVITAKKSPGAGIAGGAEGITDRTLTMAFLSNSSTSHKSSITLPSTGSSPSDWRHYWAAESIRSRSDWQGLVALHLQIIDSLRSS
jgi:hypothetical protein